MPPPHLRWLFDERNQYGLSYYDIIEIYPEILFSIVNTQYWLKLA